MQSAPHGVNRAGLLPILYLASANGSPLKMGSRTVATATLFDHSATRCPIGLKQSSRALPSRQFTRLVLPVAVGRRTGLLSETLKPRKSNPARAGKRTLH